MAGVFGKRFSETINLFQPHVIRCLITSVKAKIMRDEPRS
jgi:hypothetical protein